MLIALLNQNGGCGKSTMAVHLAAHLAERGYNVAVMDCDGQAASKRWLALAAPGITVFDPMKPDEIERTYAAYAPHLDVVIADTPPTLGPVALKLAKLADHILMPIKPSPINQEGTEQAIAVIARTGGFKGKGPDYAWAFMTMVNSAAASLKRCRLHMAMLGVGCATATIGQRETYITARHHGVVVGKLRDVNPIYTAGARIAQAELEAVFSEILPHGLRNPKCGEPAVAGATESGAVCQDAAA